MAIIKCNPSKTVFDTSSYPNSPTVYMRITITEVTYDTSTGNYTVKSNRQYKRGTGSTQWNFGGVLVTIGATSVDDSKSGAGVTVGGTDVYSNISSSGHVMTWQNYSYDTTYDNDTYVGPNLTVYGRLLADWKGGWWNDSDKYLSTGSDVTTFTAPLSIGNPTISGTITNKTSAGRGSSNGSAKIDLTTSHGSGASSSTYSAGLSGGTQTSNTDPVSLTGLKNNTTYTWVANITNNADLKGSATGTFYLDPVAPSVTLGSVTTARQSNGTYTATIPTTFSGDTNRAWSSYTVSGGGTVSSTATGITITGLQPNKSYTINVTPVDKNNGGPYTAALTGAAVSKTFTTPCNKPTIASTVPSYSSSTTNSITVGFSATGDTNAAVTNYIVYYKTTSASSYSNSGNLSTNTTYTIPNLSADTNYNIYVTATNAAGTTTSTTKTYSTKLGNPSLTLSAPTMAEDANNDGKFTATLKPSASISPSRTLTYTYSCNLSGVTAVTTTNATHTFTNLPEETAITFTVKVVADATGTNSADTSATKTTNITTDSAQARVRMKIKGTWVQGKLFIKKNGTWVKAKKVYIKKSGAWVQGKNQ